MDPGLSVVCVFFSGSIQLDAKSISFDLYLVLLVYLVLLLYLIFLSYFLLYSYFCSLHHGLLYE
jgi:hypothetical protein